MFLAVARAPGFDPPARSVPVKPWIAKQTGERSAGNPQAAFDGAGAGNVAWSRCCDTRNRKGEATGNTNFGLNRRASPRPYHRGDGKRGAGHRPPSYCAHPQLYLKRSASRRPRPAGHWGPRGSACWLKDLPGLVKSECGAVAVG